MLYSRLRQLRMGPIGRKMSEIRWEVESLRATAFYRAGKTPIDVSGLWELLMHRQPDQVSSRPHERIQVAEGTFGGNDKQLRCAIGPERG